jgi:hypothetical protein
MKQFDIRTDISGSRIVIYPAGTSPVRKPPAIVRVLMDYRHRWIAHMLKELRYG